MTMDELKAKAAPLMEALKSEPNPYHTVVITEDSVKLLTTDVCIPATEPMT